MKAYKFVNVGGKTFYFNVNESKNGNIYLSITGKVGGEPASEKIVMFPNQIPSFLHSLIQTYAEICRREEMPVYFNMPCATPRDPTSPAPALEPQVPSPPDVEAPECGKCGRKPGKWYEDNDLDSMGALHVYVTDETGNYLKVRCQSCSWIPEDSEMTDDKYGMFRRNSKGYDFWKGWRQ